MHLKQRTRSTITVRDSLSATLEMEPHGHRSAEELAGTAANFWNAAMPPTLTPAAQLVRLAGLHSQLQLPSKGHAAWISVPLTNAWT